MSPDQSTGAAVAAVAGFAWIGLILWLSHRKGRK